MPVTQASGRSGRGNFASSNSYQGSLCSFVGTFEVTISMLFPVLSSLFTYGCMQVMEETHLLRGKMELIM